MQLAGEASLNGWMGEANSPHGIPRGTGNAMARYDPALREARVKTEHRSATEKLQALQNEVDSLKKKEGSLRSLLGQVASKGASSLEAATAVKTWGVTLNLDPDTSISDVEEMYRTTRVAREFGQHLQELLGVLKVLEKQLRGLEAAEAGGAGGGDLQAFIAAVTQAVESHNAAALKCDEIAQMETGRIPVLLLELSTSAHKRASLDMNKLLDILKRMLRKETSNLNWPPPITTTTPTSPVNGYNSKRAFAGFQNASPQAVHGINCLMAIMIAFQRSIQRTSFDAALNLSLLPPELWAVEALAAPLVEKLRQHFVQQPQTNSISHPEWLFHIAAKLAGGLGADLGALDHCLQIQSLRHAYHMPFEFARALRSGVQAILKEHTLPKLHGANKHVLWLNFAEKALDFEKQMAPLQGLKSRPEGELGHYAWREGSCFATICSIQEYRDAWWEAERFEAWSKVEEVLRGKNIWTPTHIARGFTPQEGLQDYDPEKTDKQAHECEFWQPLVAEVLLETLVELSKTVGVLPESMTREFAVAVPQRLCQDLATVMKKELKRLEDFKDELSSDGLKIIGGILGAAHFLENELNTATGPLLAFDAGEIEDDIPGPLIEQANAFAILRTRGVYQAALRVHETFAKSCSSYFSRKGLQKFSSSNSLDFREGYPSQVLFKPVEWLLYHLEQLSTVLDSKTFTKVWKCLAQVLNRLIYNTCIMEAQFSILWYARPHSLFLESVEAAKLLSIDDYSAEEAAKQLALNPMSFPPILKNDLNLKLKTFRPENMDEKYDAIVLGTGLKECIISGLLSSVAKLKVGLPMPTEQRLNGRERELMSMFTTQVLHIDRNNYYGGASASLNLNQLWERFRPGQKPPSFLGASRDYNVDLVPKFIMANGNLVKILVVTDVTKYLEFKGADGSYVLNKGRVEKVPATDFEALKSPLLGLFEKRRARNFFLYVQDYKQKDPRTHKGMDLARTPMQELYKYYGLDAQTIDFIGHAIALHRDDSYLREPALETVQKIQLYNDSLHRFEGTKAPYIYPMYGLGELPQAFARLSAVYGGTYMLNKADAKVVYDDSGKFVGVESEGETAKADFVVGDPSYFPDKVLKTSNVVRAICILSHPIPNTDNANSVQIIIPQRQVSRKSDIYVFCASYAHQCAAKDKWIAFVSTTVETKQPERELNPGLALLGKIDEQLVEVTPVYEPLEDGKQTKTFVSKGYDATSHFETTVDDVLELYTRITGKLVDLDSKPAPVQ